MTDSVTLSDLGILRLTVETVEEPLTEFMIRIRLAMTPEQERRYRAEHGLSDAEPLRRHLLDHVHRELTGEGDLGDWWTARVS